MMIQLKNIIILCLLLFYSCGQQSKKSSENLNSFTTDNTKMKNELKKIGPSDVQDIELILKRGAFHYDAFKLKGNNLSFIPHKTEKHGKLGKYHQPSTTVLSNSAVIELINDLLANNIFEMNSEYENNTSCNSMLEIELKVKDRSIKITCHDYQRGCPKILTELENKLVKLHGKGLKRYILPG
jgi:hypothetical protein